MRRRKIMILCIFAACVMFMACGTIERQKEEMDENNNMNISGKKDSSNIDFDTVINIGDFSVSLYENEQEILSELDKAGLKYEKVEHTDNKKYNYYYNVGDGADEFIQVYFLDEECVRIRINSDEMFAHTSKGIHPGNTYFQMVEQYGDSYERHTYMGKEMYTVYRYMLQGEVIEFGIPGDATAEIYNVDIYVLGQFPIYDYGEELIVDEKIY